MLQLREYAWDDNSYGSRNWIAYGIKETNLSEIEKERRRRIWYCLFILDRLVALQLGGAPMVRDADFSVELPSIVLDGEPSEVSYLCHMVGLSKVIGFVIDHLYRPAQAVIPLERLLETISALDKELLDWRDGLPDHLRFDHAHPFEQNAVFKRQVYLYSELADSTEKLPWN